MTRFDQKRLLRAWLDPKHKRLLFKLAVRYARVFRESPEDLLQRTFEILWQRASFGPDENVVWRAQDAMQNLAANRKRSFAYKKVGLFENRPSDDEDEERDDEARVPGHAPDPEALLIERETTETYRAFIAELKEELRSNRVALGVVTEGEDENFDTTELQQKLGASREQIYEARRSIKAKAVELRDRWHHTGRELPGFPGVKKEEKKS
jgi:DNA-directed RNA polymerase specialized sigma24 family protein